MKRNFGINGLYFIALCFIWFSGFGASPSKISTPFSHNNSFHPAPYRPIHLAQNYGQLPMAFEPNQGQTDSQVQYLARGRGYNLFITNQEAVLVLKKPTANPPISPPRKRAKGFSRTSVFSKAKGNTPPTVIHMELDGAKSGGVFESLEKLPGISNYFIGKDRSKWHRNIPQYGKVQTSDIYPGVDLVYFGNQGKLEYDFVVKPGADPNAIHLKYEGAKAARVNAQGDLELDTDQGTLLFRAPSLYQESEGLKNSVEGRYRLDEVGKVGFEVKDYDRTKPLVIDPVLDFSTFWGGSGQDESFGIALDSSGNAYITGNTQSADFPTVNPYQGGLGVGSGGTAYQNAFVAEINSAGTAMLYSTYLGGSYYDQGNAIAVDSNGDAYVSGFTYSPDFPITPGAIQSTFGASGTYTLYDTYNTFVTELNPSGSGLIYSTYWGGSVDDMALGIALDSSGDAYVTGFTYSPDFPKYNPIQSSLAGTENAFVYEIGPSGGSIVYSTYLGGNGTDEGEGIAVDGSGNAYVTGNTTSTNFPTQSPYQGGLLGVQNGFVTKVNAGGTTWIYSTYLGGSGSGGDGGDAIAVDNSGDAYVVGYTSSNDFPTQSPFQGTYGGGNYNAFVTELNPSASSLIYSTFLGGSGEDYAEGVALDGLGDAYVTGLASSPNFPTQNPIQANLSASGVNVFISEFVYGGSGLIFSTYLGGSGGGEIGKSLATDGQGDVYVTGYTFSSDFPTLNPVQGLFGGDNDAFILEITQPLPPTPTFTPTTTPTFTPTSTFTATPTFTATFTSTFTPTTTFTFTPTATATPTATSTCTSTPTVTASSTSTSTSTFTPTNSPTPTITTTATPTLTSTPVIISVTVSYPYPNPVSGTGPLSIPVQAPTGSMAHWTVYTTAFRKVYDHTQSIPGNNGILSWDLRDTWGSPVANGVYYIRVAVTGLTSGTQILKVLVIR